MIIIGVDCHPGFQQIVFVDTETGDYGEQRLEHSEGAEKFYRDLAGQDGWYGTYFHESEMALISEWMQQYGKKVIDSAGIVRDAG